MTEQYSIRQLTSSDAARLARLLAWRRAGGDTPPDNSQPPEIEYVRAAETALQTPGFALFVAELDSVLVGYISVATIPKPDPRRATLYVDELWVPPPHRRRGIGRALLEQVRRLGQALGAWRIRLVVNPENGAASRLYKQAGFAFEPTFFCEREP